MGFRSTFVTEDRCITWPAWFVKKYEKWVFFSERGNIASRYEAKTYMMWEELPSDIQRVINKAGVKEIVLVYLHECGGITRYQIGKAAILISEPDGWERVEGVTHDYCYGCSDAKIAPVK